MQYMEKTNPILQHSLRSRGQHFHVNEVPAQQFLTPETRHLNPEDRGQKAEVEAWWLNG